MSADNRLGSLRGILDSPPRRRLASVAPETPADPAPAKPGDPVEQPPADRSETFSSTGPVDEVSDAALSKASDQVAPADASVGVDGTSQTTPAAAPSDSATRAARPVAPVRIDATIATRVRVGVRMPESAHRYLTGHAREAGLTHAAVLLEAVEAGYTDGSLADRVAELRRAEVPQRTGLFTAEPPRSAAEPKVAIEIRLRQRDLEVLDQLVLELGANDRTELINASLFLRTK